MQNDYISREEAISLLYYHSDEACSAVVADFEALPAADVRPVVRGEWERLDDPSFLLGDFKCSNCGYIENDIFTPTFTPGENCYYYCPNCGAEMKEAAHDRHP